MQETARQQDLLAEGPPPIMVDFNYREIDWKRVDPNGGSDIWRNKFLEYVQENYLYQHDVENAGYKKADHQHCISRPTSVVLPPCTVQIDNYRYNLEIGNITCGASLWKSYKAMLESRVLGE